MTTSASVEPADPADQAAPLDSLLVDAALSPVRRFTPDLSAAKLSVALIRRPGGTARQLGSLAAEAARIVIGTSTLAPSVRDRRFTDDAWKHFGVRLSCTWLVVRLPTSSSPWQDSAGATSSGSGS